MRLESSGDSLARVVNARGETLGIVTLERLAGAVVLDPVDGSLGLPLGYSTRLRAKSRMGARAHLRAVPTYRLWRTCRFARKSAEMSRFKLKPTHKAVAAYYDASSNSKSWESSTRARSAPLSSRCWNIRAASRTDADSRISLES